MGLGAGLTLVDARTRFPRLLAVEHDAEADRRWLGRLAQDCIRYAPVVAMAPPDGISIDIAGSAHLFGGEDALAGQVADWLAALGMTARIACGLTAEAAQALARHALLPVADEQAALRALPASALGLSEEVTQGLQRAGLGTVGASASRPSASIAARFGIEAVRAIDRLLGREQAPVTPLPQRSCLRFERRFAEPVTHQDAIARSLLGLLRSAAKALQERELGGRRFRLQLRRTDGATHLLDIQTGVPTRDPALVLRLFDERTGALADPLDPGFGYDSMLLTIPVTQPLAVFQPALDRESKAEMAVAELVDRLSTRLGPGAVRRIVLRDSHIPEQSQLALPAIQSPAAAPWPAAPPGEPPARPLFLFDPPQRVEVIAEVPDGPPHRFRWRRKLHEVRLYEGPERIAAEWWQREGGEQAGQGGLTRDYYRIEDVRGRRFWIFRHGLYDEKPDPRWYLHGLFA
jgi:protein ImuB